MRSLADTTDTGSNHQRMMHPRRASSCDCLKLNGPTHGSVGLDDTTAHTTKQTGGGGVDPQRDRGRLDFGGGE